MQDDLLSKPNNFSLFPPRKDIISKGKYIIKELLKFLRVNQKSKENEKQTYSQKNEGVRTGYEQEIIDGINCEGQCKQGIRIGNWKFFYNRELIADCQYNQNGQKQGHWFDFLVNSFNQQQLIVLKGVYEKGKRVGYWEILCREYESQLFKQIGFGNYDDFGQKVGKWREIIESQYYCLSQLVWEGYYFDDIKIGQWNIYYRESLTLDFHLIGGGAYNEKGEKVRVWKEINLHQYQLKSQIVWEGKYNLGKRFGKWNILFREDIFSKFQIIGGGYYDENEQKVGLWRDINENYFNIQAQILQQGRYQAGQKVGEWKIIFCRRLFSDNICIGGGKYDDRGQKVGWWLEINEKNYSYHVKKLRINQTHKEGEYQAGLKIGKWNILYKKDGIEDFVVIGGGHYNQFGKKTGIWKKNNKVRFWRKSQIIYEGQYKDGIKFGEWKILFKEQQQQEFLQIGGGQFNAKGQKIGKWRDINENYFSPDSLVVWEGNYLNNIKIGYWRILFQINDQKGFQEIGGGCFDQNGSKIGDWKEINEKTFQLNSQIIQEGKYQQGMRVGQWNILYQQKDEDGFKYIGGGNYDCQGQKYGQWGEINLDCFTLESQILWEGQYSRGLRVGNWNILYSKPRQFDFQVIGGGTYDANGIKLGTWKDIEENQFSLIKIISKGLYTNGFKVGNWNIFHYNKLHIGGGQYDFKGLKVGQWIEISDQLGQHFQIQGKYENGLRIGEWDIFQYQYGSYQREQLGTGLYNEKGQKIGQWLLFTDGMQEQIEFDYGTPQIQL